MPHIFEFDMLLWVEGFQSLNGEFANLGSGIEGGGEASKNCCMQGKVQVKVMVDGNDNVNCIWFLGFALQRGGGQGR